MKVIHFDIVSDFLNSFWKYCNFLKKFKNRDFSKYNIDFSKDQAKQYGHLYRERKK